jgi:hypothetical protein
VPYIPMPKGRGFTARLVNDQILFHTEPPNDTVVLVCLNYNTTVLVRQ